MIRLGLRFFLQMKFYTTRREPVLKFNNNISFLNLLCLLISKDGLSEHFGDLFDVLIEIFFLERNWDFLDSFELCVVHEDLFVGGEK
jgi:hypothetical protein